eukprot:GFYU01008296.1.p1 GENE.GFYU01008296.1~~GFYU01008296.1.p1  ORF type:complete len:646 (-),score=133.55 GFYU01008296.1:729-2666(-)
MSYAESQRCENLKCNRDTPGGGHTCAWARRDVFLDQIPPGRNKQLVLCNACKLNWERGKFCPHCGEFSETKEDHLYLYCFNPSCRFQFVQAKTAGIGPTTHRKCQIINEDGTKYKCLHCDTWQPTEPLPGTTEHTAMLNEWKSKRAALLEEYKASKGKGRGNNSNFGGKKRPIAAPSSDTTVKPPSSKREKETPSTPSTPISASLPATPTTTPSGAMALPSWATNPYIPQFVMGPNGVPTIKPVDYNAIANMPPPPIPGMTTPSKYPSSNTATPTTGGRGGNNKASGNAVPPMDLSPQLMEHIAYALHTPQAQAKQQLYSGYSPQQISNACQKAIKDECGGNFVLASKQIGCSSFSLQEWVTAKGSWDEPEILDKIKEWLVFRPIPLWQRNAVRELLKQRTVQNPKLSTMEALCNGSQLMSTVESVMVPVRLDIELDGIRLKDTLIWNATETYITPQDFAVALVEDLDLPHVFEREIEEAIITQVERNTQWMEARADLESQVGEIIFPMQLDIRVDDIVLRDQFDWNIVDSKNSPESFAKTLCSDLGLGPEFETAAAHSIREQILGYLQALVEGRQIDDYDPFEDPTVRDDGEAIYWQPTIERTDLTDIDQSESKQRREARYRRRRGPVLALDSVAKRGRMQHIF